METTDQSRRGRPLPRGSRGVTLVELMVTLAVLAVLVSAAAPSFVNMIRNNQRTALLNQLLADIQLARSAAIKSGQPHVICPAGAGGATQCGDDWTQGWVVFRDNPRGNTRFQLGPDDGPDATVSVTDPAPDRFTVIHRFGDVGIVTGMGVLAFRPNGQTQSQNGSFAICDPRGATESRSIAILATGRAYIRDSSKNSSNVELCPEDS